MPVEMPDSSISRQLVQAMGGNLWVKSTPGKGLCFSVKMPAVKMDLSVLKETWFSTVAAGLPCIARAAENYGEPVGISPFERLLAGVCKPSCAQQ